MPVHEGVSGMWTDRYSTAEEQLKKHHETNFTADKMVVAASGASDLLGSLPPSCTVSRYSLQC